MNHDKRNVSTPAHNLASLLRGLYQRVATRLDVDPSYVSRIARGERRSEAIEAALESEMSHIAKMMKNNQNGSGRNAVSRNGSNHNGAGGRGAKKTRTAK